jgi:hypothetical protein
MLLASVFLAMTLYPDEHVVEDTKTEVQAIKEKVPEPETVYSVRKPAVRTATEEVRKPISNVDVVVTPEVYGQQLSALPPLFVPLTKPQIGNVFMYDILQRPQVRRMKFAEYKNANLIHGDIVAYIWASSTNPDNFLQYAAIATSYGNVYVTCDLNEEAEIINPDGPLHIYYDNVALGQMVAVAAESQPHRFPTHGSFDKDYVRSLDDLNFLFGNPLVLEESYNINFLL